MVMLVKQFDIFALRNTSNGWTTKAQRTRTVNDIQTKMKLTERKTISL